jgi:hypothetical protein
MPVGPAQRHEYLVGEVVVVHVVAVDRAEPGMPFVTSAGVWTPVGFRLSID